MENLSELLKLPKRVETNKSPLVETKKIIAEEKKINLITGEEILIPYWTIDPAFNNQLLWADNSPVLAREVHYGFQNINWSAGQGWPYYHVPQPLDYIKDYFYFKGFPCHCIVVHFGDIYSHIPIMQGGDRGIKTTEVFVLVNDNIYTDNVGSIGFYITAYSQEE